MMCSCAVSFGARNYLDKVQSQPVSGKKPPLTLSDISDDAIFGEYFFDTRIIQRGEKTQEELKKDEEHEDLKEEGFFTMAPSYARCKDPISNKTEEWLAIGLHSKYDGNGCKKYGRPPVNLVVVLDVSGSMSLSFDTGEGWRNQKSKMDIAKESLLAMLKHLKDEDQLSIVTFNEEALVIHPLAKWKTTNAEELKSKIMNFIQAEGGTDLSCGYRMGSLILNNQLKKVEEEWDLNQKNKVKNAYRREQRILFLTDMNPNSGEMSKEGLFGMANEYATKSKIYTTFVGVGLDFNSELVNHITTGLKGSHYMTVNSSAEFSKIMDDNFDYTIFPILFDFKLQFKSSSDALTIDQVYGTRESEDVTDHLLTVKTMFPSDKNEENITKGCVVLIKLKRDGNVKSDGKNEEWVELVCSYEDGTTFSKEEQVIRYAIPRINAQLQKEDFYESSAIQKAIVLTQFINLSRASIAEVPVTEETGIPSSVKEKEQKKTRRTDKGDDNSGEKMAHVELLESFEDYYKKHAAVLKDDTMLRELKVLNQIIDWKKAQN